MLENVSIGRYYKRESILHETDPRVKAILYIVYLVAIFMIKTTPGILLLTATVIIQILMAKITLRIIWETIKPIIPITIFILILNMLTIRTGNVLFEWKIIKITDYGISRAVLMS